MPPSDIVFADVIRDLAAFVNDYALTEGRLGRLVATMRGIADVVEAGLLPVSGPQRDETDGESVSVIGLMCRTFGHLDGLMVSYGARESIAVNRLLLAVGARVDAGQNLDTITRFLVRQIDGAAQRAGVFSASVPNTVAAIDTLTSLCRLRADEINLAPVKACLSSACIDWEVGDAKARQSARIAFGEAASDLPRHRVLLALDLLEAAVHGPVEKPAAASARAHARQQR
jgi:hypothetical protein